MQQLSAPQSVRIKLAANKHNNDMRFHAPVARMALAPDVSGFQLPGPSFSFQLPGSYFHFQVSTFRMDFAGTAFPYLRHHFVSHTGYFIAGCRVRLWWWVVAAAMRQLFQT